VVTGSATFDDLSGLETAIDAWVRDLPDVVAIDRDDQVTRWYVRMRGVEKNVVTIWVTLRDRGLHFETYVAPGPQENFAEAFEYVLRVNQRLVGCSFCIGVEDAFYLIGSIAIEDLTAAAFDRMMGSLYAASEECFTTIMRIGYASVYRGPPGSS
jgi:hypothetical protein